MEEVKHEVRLSFGDRIGKTAGMLFDPTNAKFIELLRNRSFLMNMPEPPPRRLFPQWTGRGARKNSRLRKAIQASKYLDTIYIPRELPREGMISKWRSASP